jgi:hypothetical protein
MKKQATKKRAAKKTARKAATKPNGIFGAFGRGVKSVAGRRLATRKATRAYKQELKLESRAEAAREKRRDAERSLGVRVEREKADKAARADLKRQERDRTKAEAAERKREDRERETERRRDERERAKEETARRKELLAEQADRKREEKIAEREREDMLDSRRPPTPRARRRPTYVQTGADELDAYANPSTNITPAKANKLLALNVGNRPVDKQRVNELARAMKAGTHRRKKPIIITNGILTDGQHTMLAILKSGVTVPLRISRVRLNKNPMPTHCADCEAKLGKGSKQMSDSRYVCAACAKSAKTKGAAKAQRALFGGMDRDLFDTLQRNPAMTMAEIRARLGDKEIAKLLRQRDPAKAIERRAKAQWYVNNLDKMRAYFALLAQVVKKNPAQYSTAYPVKVAGYCIPEHYRAKPTPRPTGATKTKPAAKKAAKKKATRAAAPGVKPVNRSRKKDVDNLSISQFVRREGGIKPSRDGNNSGEIDRLRPSRTKTTGLVNKYSKYFADQMRENAGQYGFEVNDLSDNDFLDLVHDDALGYYKTYSTAKDDWDFTDTRTPAQHAQSGAYLNPRRGGSKLRRIKTRAQLVAFLKTNPATQAKLFQFPTGAKPLANLQRVQSVDRDRAGNYPKGVVLGQTGEFNRVLFEGFDRAHLIAPHLLKKINPAASGGRSAIAPTKRPSAATRRGFETFTGREASQVDKVECSHLYDGIHTYELGTLIEIETADGTVYKGQGRRLLSTARGKMIIGGLPLFPAKIALRNDQVEAVSPVVHVVYKQFKPGVGDRKPEKYIHLLAEESGEQSRPHLGRDRNGYAILHGGGYRIEARGIVD